MTDTMTIKFWGVRGSHPMPGTSTMRYGGNTPCVEVSTGKQTLILDAGTGIIGLGRDLLRRAAGTSQPVEATLLFSHMHHDHTQGFPFFVPAYIGTSKLHIFGPGIFERDLEDMLAHTMLPPSFPVALQELPSLRIMRSVHETDVILLGESVGGVAVRNVFHQQVESDSDLVRIRVLHSYAHPGDVLIYRIDWREHSVVYATDTEGYEGVDQRLAAFARGAEVLIHDAQYTEEHYLGRLPGFPSTQGWGHSTARMACDVANAAGVGRLVLFHHEPRYDDEVIASIEAQSQARFANTVAAHEGLEIRLGENTHQNASAHAGQGLKTGDYRPLAVDA